MMVQSMVLNMNQFSFVTVPGSYRPWAAVKTITGLRRVCQRIWRSGGLRAKSLTASVAASVAPVLKLQDFCLHERDARAYI
jgi:hypothetical protein